MTETSGSEKINGVSFEEYAAACGNLMQGMSEAEVLKILGLEKPVWDDTVKKWNVQLGELAVKDMAYMTRYGEIFANPKVGRFANAASPAADITELLKIVPDLNAYLKIQIHQSVANTYGFDPVTILAEYGIDLGKWGALNMHYGKEQNKLFENPHSSDFNERLASYSGMREHWTQYFESKYSQSKVDLGQDIKF